MDGDATRGRGKKARGDTGGRTGTRDRALNAIQKAITSNTSDSQANIRQGKAGNTLEQVRVHGWKQSKAASNRDGGLESLLTFLEKKLNTHESKTGGRARITKVCESQHQKLAVPDSMKFATSCPPPPQPLPPGLPSLFA
jgi:nuclear RNA export factor